MDKKIIGIGIFLILVCVGLSGCEESTDGDTKDTSQYTVIEAIAQVVNSTEQPVKGERVTIEFAVNGAITHSAVKFTDNTGWSGFVSESVRIPDAGLATVNIYLTDNEHITKMHLVHHLDAKNKAIDGVFYWSISERLVTV